VVALIPRLATVLTGLAKLRRAVGHI
jgi:hypothetical protein